LPPTPAFGHCWCTFSLRKTELDTFSCGTSLWRLLAEYKPLNLIHW
jgi:hypothetical protein